MKTKRKDGRGHYPPGKRRNKQPPPKGWESVERFLADVRDHCQANRRTAALAEYLGVARKSVYDWLTGKKWPKRETMLAIARWYRSER